MIGLFLLIISTILKVALSPILYLYGTVRSLLKCDFNQWNFDLAIAKDQYGNGLGKWLFNDLLITKSSRHPFGNIDETISSVIGKNRVEGTLSFSGKVLDKILEIFDNNHSIESIDETEGESVNNK
jgi:8-oxo-dGTP diphosphatase